MSAFFWLSESRQASIDMTGDNTASALQRLLSVCSTFDERDAILRGWWVWVEESADGEEIRREERVQE